MHFILDHDPAAVRRSPTVHGDYTKAPSYLRSVPALPLTPQSTPSQIHIPGSGCFDHYPTLLLNTLKSFFTETY